MSRDWIDVSITSHELSQLHHEINYLTAENEKLKRIVEVYEKANEFYAHIGNWNGGEHANRTHPLDMEEILSRINGKRIGKFGGKTARQAKVEVERIRGEGR